MNELITDKSESILCVSIYIKFKNDKLLSDGKGMSGDGPDERVWDLCNVLYILNCTLKVRVLCSVMSYFNKN